MNEKSIKFKEDFLIIGYILLFLGDDILQLKWILIISLLLFLVTFIVNIYYALKNRKFELEENDEKKIADKKACIEAVQAAFLSFLWVLINIYKLYNM